MLKSNSKFPALPKMFTELSPQPPNPIFYDGGLLIRMFDTWMLKDASKMQALQAEISEAQLRQTKAISAIMFEIETFDQKLQFSLEEFEHKKSMMKHEQVTAQAKSTEAYYDAKITEMDFKIREREYNKHLKEAENEG